MCVILSPFMDLCVVNLPNESTHLRTRDGALIFACSCSALLAPDTLCRERHREQARAEMERELEKKIAEREHQSSSLSAVKRSPPDVARNLETEERTMPTASDALLQQREREIARVREREKERARARERDREWEREMRRKREEEIELQRERTSRGERGGEGGEEEQLTEEERSPPHRRTGDKIQLI